MNPQPDVPPVRTYVRGCSFDLVGNFIGRRKVPADRLPQADHHRACLHPRRAPMLTLPRAAAASGYGHRTRKRTDSQQCLLTRVAISITASTLACSCHVASPA